MWVTAVLGIATKFDTATLAVMFRGYDDAGHLAGRCRCTPSRKDGPALVAAGLAVRPRRVVRHAAGVPDQSARAGHARCRRHSGRHYQRR
ncbi:MAG: hypothetical protein U5K38_10195 [Woeseiaceae bacterium]|nr:hypothetical protein [Woeseiaceae bacterium]